MMDNFMGVSEDACRYEETTKALEYSHEYLKIRDYIQVVGYEIDEVMFDKFWQSISRKQSPTWVLCFLNGWVTIMNRKDLTKQSSFNFSKATIFSSEKSSIQILNLQSTLIL